MSKLLRKSISYKNIQLELQDNILTLQGKNGSIKMNIDIFKGAKLLINKEEQTIMIQKCEKHKNTAICGTLYSILKNNIDGLSQLFTRTITLNGVGYKYSTIKASSITSDLELKAITNKLINRNIYQKQENAIFICFKGRL